MSKALSLYFRVARSFEPAGILAHRYGVSTETIRKWRKRGAVPRISCLETNRRRAAVVWAFIDVLHAASMLLGHRHERLCTVGNSLALRRLAIWAECEGESAPYGEVPSGAAASARV